MKSAIEGLGFKDQRGLVTTSHGDVSVARKKQAAGASKADLIRQTAGALPKPVRPRDVLAALAEQGIDVSRAQISAVLAGMGMRPRRRRRSKVAANGNATTARSTATASPGLTLQSLLAAKRLADQLGSVDAAKQAVDALAKLS